MLVYTLKGHTGWVNTLMTLPNGNLVSGADDGIIKIWNPNTGSLVFTLTGHTSTVSSLAILPNGYLASASWDSTVKIWKY
jgi:WD40 repeat protein